MTLCNWHVIWLQNFAVFWMFYSFFWAIPRRLNFMCRRFETFCLFHFIGGVSRKNNRDENSRVFLSQTFTYINTLEIPSRLFFLLTPPIKSEETECSETSAHKIQHVIWNLPKKRRLAVAVLGQMQFLFSKICSRGTKKCLYSLDKKCPKVHPHYHKITRPLGKAKRLPYLCFISAPACSVLPASSNNVHV